MENHRPVFIVTAELDAASFEWLNGLRRAHFPVARNVLDAHLTLFHQVDGEGVDLLRQALNAKPCPPIALRFSGLRKLGRGVAVDIVAPELAALRSTFAQVLAGRLTRQDAQGFRPHVTIQNKVDPDVANSLYEWLAQDFMPRIGEVPAIQIWEYLGGPWKFASRLPLVGTNMN